MDNSSIMTRRTRFVRAILRLSGLQVYLPFSVVEGTVARNYAPANKNLLNGTINGSPTLGQPGPLGRAINFDASNDYITVPTTPNVNSFSIVIVFYWPGGVALNSARRLIDWQDASGGFQLVHLSPSTGKLRFEIYNGGSVEAQVDSVNAHNIGWHIGVCTYQPNSAKLYVDGALLNTDTSCTMTAAASTAIHIGQDIANVQRYLGLGQHFALFNRVLTAAEILKISRIGNFL